MLEVEWILGVRETDYNKSTSPSKSMPVTNDFCEVVEIESLEVLVSRELENFRHKQNQRLEKSMDEVRRIMEIVKKEVIDDVRKTMTMFQKELRAEVEKHVAEIRAKVETMENKRLETVANAKRLETHAAAVNRAKVVETFANAKDFFPVTIDQVIALIILIASVFCSYYSWTSAQYPAEIRYTVVSLSWYLFSYTILGNVDSLDRAMSQLVKSLFKK